MSWRRSCASDLDTRRAGEEFASILRCGDVVLLNGPLGAGKTTWAQGVAKGLGVIERVTSPTFTLVRQHACHDARGIEILHHADVFRVRGLDEVLDLALGELVEESGVALVEWGELASTVFGRDVFTVRFSPDERDVRVLEVDGALTRGRDEALERWAHA